MNSNSTVVLQYISASWLHHMLANLMDYPLKKEKIWQNNEKVNLKKVRTNVLPSRPNH